MDSAQTARQSGDCGKGAGMNYQEREGAGALAIAAIAPYFWSPLILASAGLVLTAIILGIIALVRGRIWQGILLIVLSPCVAFVALLANAIP